jgi:hypothetical protein
MKTHRKDKKEKKIKKKIRPYSYRPGICFRIIHFILISNARVFSGFYFWNVNRTPTLHLSNMSKVAFKDVSTKISEPTYWTILFVMLKIYFIHKVAGKKIQKGYIKLNYVVCLSDTGSSWHGSLIVLVNKRADWNVPVSYIKCMSTYSACGFSTKINIKSKHNFESGHFQTFCYSI